MWYRYHNFIQRGIAISTIRDVAKLAGVSVSNISRYLNKSGYVNSETEQLIKAAITKLNYAPNQVARGLAGKKTNTIALILPDISNLFFFGLSPRGGGCRSHLRIYGYFWKFGVVTTLGADGSAYLTDDGGLCTLTGYKVPVVDTTGAGDCYNAGLALSIAAGRSLEEAVDYASVVSALAVTKFGAQAGMPTEDEALRFVEKQKITG